MHNDLSPQSPPPLRRRPARRGFTLIEMLVVIGIILLLIGMAVAGFSSMAKHAKAQHTKGVLEAAKAMLAEYEATAGKRNYSTFKGYWDSSTIPVNATQGRAAAAVNVGVAPAATTIPWQLYSDQVLAKLLELPNNKAILDKLPPEQVVKDATNTYYELLDGYGHPLLFVPSIGLGQVTASGQTGTMQSDAVLHNATNPTAAPNPRYFWMSAGPDNDPATGDDNHYSFEQ